MSMRLFFKKVLPGVLVYTALLLENTTIVYADIVPGAPTIVHDPINHVETAATSISSGTQTIIQTAQKTWDTSIKGHLDAIAYQAGQLALNQITENTISWIRGGFNGSPSFAIDPERLFNDLADMVAGDLANQIRGIAVCDFDATFKYRLTNSILNRDKTKLARTLTCPFDTIDEETCDANGENCQTISPAERAERFGDDFVFGGWNSFTAFLEDGGNQFGIAITTTKELNAQTAERTRRQEQSLNQSGGFLDVPDTSPESCNYTAGQKVDLSDPDITPERKAAIQRSACSKKTPGKLIGDTLGKVTGIDMDRLGFADNMNKIASAFIQQMIKTAINGVYSKHLGAGQSPSGVWHSSLSLTGAQCDASNVEPTDFEKGEIDALAASSPPVVDATKKQEEAAKALTDFEENVLNVAKSTMQTNQDNVLRLSAQFAVASTTLTTLQATRAGLTVCYGTNKTCRFFNSGCYFRSNICADTDAQIAAAQTNVTNLGNQLGQALLDVTTSTIAYNKAFDDYTNGPLAKALELASIHLGEVTNIAHERAQAQYMAGRNATAENDCVRTSAEDQISALNDALNASANDQSITTTDATAMTATDATLNGQLSGGTAAAVAWFQWGTDKDNLSTQTTPTGYGVEGTDYSARIHGLAPNTVYYYRAKGIAGKLELTGDVHSFVTNAQ